MNARRFSRIASRPCQSATPRFPIASLAKQSNPLPKVLSSISFQKANSHSGGSFFVNVMFMVFTFEGNVGWENTVKQVELAELPIIPRFTPTAHPTKKDRRKPRSVARQGGQRQSTQARFGGNVKGYSILAKCRSRGRIARFSVGTVAGRHGTVSSIRHRQRSGTRSGRTPALRSSGCGERRRAGDGFSRTQTFDRSAAARRVCRGHIDGGRRPGCRSGGGRSR